MKTDFKNIKYGNDMIGVITISDESMPDANTLLFVVYADDALRIVETWKHNELIMPTKLDDLAHLFLSDIGLENFHSIPGLVEVDYENAELIIEKAKDIIVKDVESESLLFAERGEIRIRK